jgi:tetratricopeptide (TPR) repeat protein
MMRALRLFLVCSLLAAGVASAQVWRGEAMMGGKVTDKAGKGIAGVKVTLTFVDAKLGTETTTNNRGQWRVEGIADGRWLLEFSKDGFDPMQVPVEVGGQVKNPNVEIKLAPAGSDPNISLGAEDAKGRELMSQQKWAEARAVYEELLKKYPQVFRIHAALAQTYHRESQFGKAADELKLYLDGDPKNVQIKMLYGVELVDAGRIDEGWQVMSGVDPAQLKDASQFKDAGFSLLRQKKPAEAIRFFNLVTERYPDDATAYYYRGFAEWQIASAGAPDAPEAKSNFEKAKADLTKFIGIAPEAPEAATAKKILEVIK